MNPSTEAGRALLGYLNGDESGLGLIGVHGDAIAAIEAEAVANERRRLAETVLREVTHAKVLDRMNRVGSVHTVNQAVKHAVNAVLAILLLEADGE